jgi:hypothetical protein
MWAGCFLEPALFLTVHVLNKQGRYLWQLIRQGDNPATDYREPVVTWPLDF